MEPLTSEQERFALSYDPWGERDASYRTLADKFVITRKPSECAVCFESIPAGDRVRAKSEVDDGRAATFRFCRTCCWLMAHRNDEPDEDGVDPYERLSDRYDRGRQNAEQARTQPSAHAAGKGA
jgi:hypothetical protein